MILIFEATAIYNFAMQLFDKKEYIYDKIISQEGITKYKLILKLKKQSLFKLKQQKQVFSHISIHFCRFVETYQATSLVSTIPYTRF